MIRFIVRRRSAVGGLALPDQWRTIDADVPELEDALDQGGRGGCAVAPDPTEFDGWEIAGAEVLHPEIAPEALPAAEAAQRWLMKRASPDSSHGERLDAWLSLVAAVRRAEGGAS